MNDMHTIEISTRDAALIAAMLGTTEGEAGSDAYRQCANIALDAGEIDLKDAEARCEEQYRDRIEGNGFDTDYVMEAIDPNYVAPTRSSRHRR